jgi:hypothetical protein
MPMMRPNPRQVSQAPTGELNENSRAPDRDTTDHIPRNTARSNTSSSMDFGPYS